MEQAEKNLNKMTLGQWLLRVLHGALIGVGAILPGVSGGVLCVLFGIYQPMMALLSHPFKAFKKYYKLFIPIIIGWAIGFVALAKLVELAFGEDSAVATCLFFGLIVGTLPSLWREAGLKGRSKNHFLIFGASFVVVFALLSLFKFSPTAEPITPNSWWYLFCGVVWGLSLVLPGLSSSSILLFMGLYEPMTAGIGSIADYLKDVLAYILGSGGEAFPPLSQVEWGCILPLLAGILLTALLTARFVNYLLENRYAVIYHVILGVVCASTILIIPFGAELTGVQIVLCVVCAVVGCGAALGLDQFGTKLKAKNNID